MPEQHDAAREETARFEALLDRGERLGAPRLPFDELSELGRLYRAHLARLARLRERDDDPAAVRHLNALCVRAYTSLYVAPPAPRSLGRLLREWLPAALGRTWHAQAASWLLLASGVMVGAALGARDPDALPALIPTSMCYSPERLHDLAHSAAARAAFLAPEATPIGQNFGFGSMLFANNTRVGLLAFATGMLAGVPTVLLHLFNGLLLGAFASIFMQAPYQVEFLAWILPHGIPELTAIALCGAGGLLLGAAVALPGRSGRRAAIRDAIDRALLLLLAAVPFFALAAATESFVRESALGTAPRLAVAGAYAVAVGAGLVAVRRLARRNTVDTRWLDVLTTPTPGAAPGSG